ncbi:RteC domain-containing protein [Pedobacter sp. ISL-68]|uniref:RteC domain-containing protein n=1 Tax=unclassified Pedobacter TaxID=2628915 RepID=UPI001BE7C39C|nr:MULTISPECIES: RteC domain-containing protein [unclassified Pedobacter]MBT2560108.1 RteC domain-containing protein [Pedobacter sp. ISL-64]MBT2589087.1 RteC domain-containing protein [Pedobacter sp. ISL-68]
MLETMTEELYVNLQDEIKKIKDQENEQVKILYNILNVIRSALSRLKAYVHETPFKNESEQIYFFKHVKPKFYALKLYYLEWYGMVTSVPAGDKDTLRKFYRDELKAVQRFFQRVAFHYQYYRLGATELDGLYFKRGMEVPSLLIPDLPEDDPEFSTSQDYLFAKIRAYELFQQEIIRRIQHLDSPEIVIHSPNAQPGPAAGLKWTGESINLVELAYGIWLTGQINSGNATISEIVRWLENTLEINIGRAYRRWTEIARRDRINTTKYIDRMRESINIRLENEDDLKRKKRQAKKNREN